MTPDWETPTHRPISLLLIDFHLIVVDNREYCSAVIEQSERKKETLPVVSGVAPPGIEKPRSNVDSRNDRAFLPAGGGGFPLRGAAKELKRSLQWNPVPITLILLRSVKRRERGMPGERRFGKCDECGVIGALVAVAFPEGGASAHFCVSCHRVFGAHPELSSFIAFLHSNASGKLSNRDEIPLSYGPGH